MHREYFLKSERQQLCHETLKRLRVEVRPRKSDFRENRVSNLNKIAWTLSFNMNVNLAHDCNSFYATGLFLIPCGFLMSSEGIERDENHDVG